MNLLGCGNRSDTTISGVSNSYHQATESLLIKEILYSFQAASSLSQNGRRRMPAQLPAGSHTHLPDDSAHHLLSLLLRTLELGHTLLASWLSGSPADGADLGVGGVSYVEMLILYEPWAGERLVS